VIIAATAQCRKDRGAIDTSSFSDEEAMFERSRRLVFERDNC
jgi:hypothetical protein